MTWARWYRFRDNVRSNMWLIPTLYALAALALGRVVPRWDGNDPLDYGFDAASIQTALNSISTGMIAFTGLVFSGVMLVVQFGSTSFSTRLMRWFWRSMIVKNALGVFVATFVFSLVALADVNRGNVGTVPTRSFLVSLGLVLCSVGMFFALLERLALLLRVAKVTRELSNQTLAVIDEVYPTPFDATRPRDSSLHRLPSGEAAQTVLHEGEPASIMAIDRGGLIRLATRADVVFQLVPAVGEHVSRGGVLFLVHGAGRVDERTLRRGVIFGEERTIDSDPSFGFRLLVDIALKALSPAVNDPTTAVQVLDRLEDLLLFASQRQLQRRGDPDSEGHLRLVYPTPSWDDLLRLALEEIRVYGAAAPQVTRRMEAVLDRLLADAPAARHESVEAFRARLEATIAAAVPIAVARQFAEVPDRQGIGPADRARG